MCGLVWVRARACLCSHKFRAFPLCQRFVFAHIEYKDVFVCLPFSTFVYWVATLGNVSFFCYELFVPSLHIDGYVRCVHDGGNNHVVIVLHPTVFVIGGNCHKYNFCRDKSFVRTNTCLSRQNMYFVPTKLCLLQQNICRDKHNFVATSLPLSRQTRVCRNKYLSRQTYLCRDKSFLSRQAYFCRDKNYICATSRH